LRHLCVCPPATSSSSPTYFITIVAGPAFLTVPFEILHLGAWLAVEDARGVLAQA
jgi:hypothetical protein